ncbi:MATE family efflux transporter [Flavobacterium sp. 3HN19-14]|uniref:MATE family efflux transporter n=1 Tax=Flavobacterium sp. 3HN19-14 TaxID=3448133 RepID=UPI003EE38E8D
MASASEGLGTQDIKKLLMKQAIPASVGILFMTVNILVDTIFVGKWIGPIAIAALTVVTPVAFLIASIGLSIGVGGTSVLSRALGEGDKQKAYAAFGHQIAMTFLLSSVLVILGLFFSEDMLVLFGAKGKILAPAKEFLYPILLAAPLQALCSVGNSVIRAEDKSKFAMIGMIVPAFGNVLLDILFIKIFNWGIFGAAMATALSFLMAFLYVVWFFLYKSELKIRPKHFIPQPKLIGEISSLSATTFSRQGVISILSVLLNHVLFNHGGENAVTIYGIISKMLMFALFPVNGITEGFLPVAGFNYGAKKFTRVRESIFTSIKFAGIIAILIYAVILIFANPIATIFSNDAKIVADTPNALRWVFAASPIIAIQLIGAAYFQAAGKAIKALLLTLTKQGFFLIPLILILPDKFGIFGVWIAFPIADILATIVTAIFLTKELKTKLKPS